MTRSKLHRVEITSNPINHDIYVYIIVCNKISTIIFFSHPQVNSHQTSDALNVIKCYILITNNRHVTLKGEEMYLTLARIHRGEAWPSATNCAYDIYIYRGPGLYELQNMHTHGKCLIAALLMSNLYHTLCR
jgi:hypothetical protein